MTSHIVWKRVLNGSYDGYAGDVLVIRVVELWTTEACYRLDGWLPEQPDWSMVYDSQDEAKAAAEKFVTDVLDAMGAQWKEES